MKKFKVIYLPHGREDKEWMNVDSTSTEQLKIDFKAGVIIDIKEIKEEDD